MTAEHEGRAVRGSTVAVLGAGAGGLSALVELASQGHRVRLWNRSEATIGPHVERGHVAYDGILGTGAVTPEAFTTDLGQALDGADVVVVCLPTLAHGALFADLAKLRCSLPIVLNPGHTGGALHARAVFAEHHVPLPPVAELSTLTYVARVAEGVVRTSGRASRVWAGCLPGGTAALKWAARLFPAVRAAPDVLFSSLSNVNLVLHPPGAVLGAAWVEATGGDFTFYVQGMTAGVVRVLAALDEERRAVAARFGHDIPPLLDEMVAIGTAGPDSAAHGDLRTAITTGVANQRIAAPDSLAHRYYREDLPCGLLPLLALAEVAEVPVPTAAALLALGSAACGFDPVETGLGAHRLGIAGMSVTELATLVRNG